MDGDGGNVGGGNAAGNAGAGGDADQSKGMMIRIPYFNGDKSDKISVDQWCGTIDRLQTLNRWTEEQAAGAASENMRGDAYTWRENLQMGTAADVAVLTSWTQMKARFKQRFEKAQTPAQKVAHLIELNQRKEESSMAFYDRVDNVLKRCTKDELAAIDGAATGQEGFIECRTTLTRLMFMRGLQPHIRVWIEAAAQQDNLTMEQIKNQAIRADNATRKGVGPTRQMAGMEEKLDGDAQKGTLEEKKEIMRALQREIAKTEGQGQGQGQQRGGGNSGRGGRGGRGRGGFVPRRLVDTPINQRTWTACYKCNSWGLHIASECKATAEDLANKPQTMPERPVGPATDRFYPN